MVGHTDDPYCVLQPQKFIDILIMSVMIRQTTIWTDEKMRRFLCDKLNGSLQLDDLENTFYWVSRAHLIFLIFS